MEAPSPIIVDEDISPLSWADDVLWASQRINLKRLDGKTKGRPPKHAPPGVSDSRFALWSFGRENPKDLMTNLVPKALSIVQKSTARDNDSDLQIAEEIEIGKMKQLLTAAILEAQNAG